jgi:hypothetical protein
MYGNTEPGPDRHERDDFETRIADTEPFDSPTPPNEVKALGGRPHHPRPDFPEETARP